MPESTNGNIAAIIQQFTEKITALVRRQTLDRIRETLGGEAAPMKRGPGRPRGSTKTGKRIRRSSEGLADLGDKLHAHVRANPGQRGEEIAAALGTDVDTMRLPMRKLIAAKKIRTEGERRGMQYFVAGGGPKPSKAKKTKNKKAKRVVKRRRASKAKRSAAKAEIRTKVISPTLAPTTNAKTKTAMPKTKAKLDTKVVAPKTMMKIRGMEKPVVAEQPADAGAAA
jgi:hypothetical protein